MTLLSLCCAVAAVTLLVPPGATPPGRPGTVRWAPHRWSGPLLVVLAVAAGGLLLTADGSVLALGLILLAAAAAAGRLVDVARRRTRAEQTQQRVVEACELLAAELRSGQPPVTALEHCAEAWPELEPVATAARLGADVPAALRRLASSPGTGALGEVAAAWVVAQGAGAGLALALGQVATSARESRATSRLVAAELSSAQATARLLALMPVVTLVMGSGTGGDPWGFLLRSPVGLTCLAVGLGLAFLGLAWIERIAAAVSR